MYMGLHSGQPKAAHLGQSLSDKLGIELGVSEGSKMGGIGNMVSGRKALGEDMGSELGVTDGDPLGAPVWSQRHV